MVKAFLTFLLIAAAVRAETRFLLEPTQTTFYMGEAVSMNFILYAPDESLEVEVIKFPEFRGFWSENMILRQGPIQLLPALMQSLTFPQAYSHNKSNKAMRPEFANLRRAVVGSYLASSIVGKGDAIVKPMKLLVRRRNGFSGNPQEVELLSEMPDIKILPLPPLPASVESFFGGVGKFSIRYESNQVLYRKEEPAVFRVNLQGEGNFAEINDLPIQFPASYEILSKRTYLQGSTNFAVKTFEFTVVPKEDGEREIPAQRLYYFSPTEKRYFPLDLPALHFSPEPAPAPEPAPRIDFPPELRWSVSRDISETFLFKFTQTLLALIFIVAFGYRRGHALWLKWQNRPQHALYLILKHARDARKKGDEEGFFRLAHQLTHEIWSRSKQDSARKLLTDIEAFRFRPHKNSSLDISEIEKTLTALIKKTG